VPGLQVTVAVSGRDLSSARQLLDPLVLCTVAVPESTLATSEPDVVHWLDVRLMVVVSGADPLRVSGGEKVAVPVMFWQTGLTMRTE